MLDIDDELVAEYVAMYLSEAEKRLAALADAVEAGDAEGIAFAAHSLKGTSATMGVEGVRETADCMETLGSKGELAGTHEILDDIRRELQLIREQESLA